MKTINDLKISKKAKLVVKTWLEEWLNTLVAQACGKEGTVYRADFINQDFFYFTDCNDILLKDPEAASVESNIKIQLRKRTIMTQLFVKTLLGTLELKKNKCSHCGYHNRYIGPLTNGHFLYCPNCYYTTIAVYPDSYNTCIAEIEKIKVEKNLDKMEK